MHHRRFLAPVVALAVVTFTLTLDAGNTPARARKGMVVSQSDIASEVGCEGDARGRQRHRRRRRDRVRARRDASHRRQHRRRRLHRLPAADGAATTFDFREMAPAGSNPTMWLKDGKYDFDIHHNSHRSVGVPGHRRRPAPGAWQKLGSKPWKDLVEPAVALARDGFEVSDGLARSLARMLVEPDDFKKYPASLAQFSKNGTPYEAGDILKQPDLARSLAAHRRPRPGRLLRGRDRRADREGDEGQRRPHHPRRPQELPGQGAGADQGHLPRATR